MSKYRVAVKEISYGFVIVDAEDEDEAREKAEEAYHNGECDWPSMEMDLGDITKEEEEQQ